MCKNISSFKIKDIALEIDIDDIVNDNWIVIVLGSERVICRHQDSKRKTKSFYYSKHTGKALVNKITRDGETIFDRSKCTTFTKRKKR